MTHDSAPTEFNAATPARFDGDPGPITPMEVDEKDMPIKEARCWILNGTNRDVDIYVNYADQPLITDIQSPSIGPVLTLDGTVDRPYGTYTLEARDKGDPDGPVLASASVPFEEGDSYSAALHRVGQEEYQLSIYTNDYSPSEDARLVARHCASHESVDGEISQNGETPEIPDDPRSGTLERGEWQTATDVTESDYLFEVVGELPPMDRRLRTSYPVASYALPFASGREEGSRPSGSLTIPRRRGCPGAGPLIVAVRADRQYAASDTLRPGRHAPPSHTWLR